MTDRTSEVDAYLATQGLRRAVDEPGWYVPVPCGHGVTRKVWATDAVTAPPLVSVPGSVEYEGEIRIKCAGHEDIVALVDAALVRVLTCDPLGPGVMVSSRIEYDEHGVPTVVSTVTEHRPHPAKKE